jgi:23S rRNA pseudouridine955/2504/2580 synthase
MKEFQYSGNDQKITKFINKELPFLTYSAVQKILRKSDIRINDKKINTDVIISDGDKIKIYYKDESITFNPSVIYEDNNVIIYYKPVKIASDGENSFADKIYKYINSEYRLCHRLDTNTDGLILFAKNDEVFEIIKNAFKLHQISKYYLACVYGNVEKEETLKAYLIKDSKIGKVTIYNEQVDSSVEIITKIKPIKNCIDHTYLEVELITGKTHQIRAHLASLGYYIIGDSKYGKEEINNQFKRHLQALTAYKIKFNFTDKKLQYLNDISIENKNLNNFFNI